MDCGCRRCRRRWSTVRPAMPSTTTTSMSPCPAIPRSPFCRAFWRWAKPKPAPGAMSSPLLSPATRPHAASAPLLPPAITTSVFMRPRPSAVWEQRPPAPACSASTPARRRRRSASPAPRRPASNRNSGRCASRFTPARRRKTGCSRPGWRRAASRASDLIECRQGFALTHGPDFAPHRALAEPPGGFHLLANLFKYHAACYFTHAPIECARKLRQEHDLDPERIARIRLRVDASTDRVCNIPAPIDGLESKFSLRQTVAMALCGVETAGLENYSAAGAHDPRLMRLRDKITIDFQTGWAQTLAELEVETTEG